MKRYYVLSALIHSLVLLTLIPKAIKKEEEKPPQQANNVPVQIEVIEHKTVGKGIKKPPENFYWGIGVETSMDNIEEVYGVPTAGYKVTRVFKGYTADSSGIEPGDFIFMIDDAQITPSNDLKGEAYRKFKLTIVRNSSIIYIHTERCKVEF